MKSSYLVCDNMHTDVEDQRLELVVVGTVVGGVILIILRIQVLQHRVNYAVIVFFEVVLVSSSIAAE